ncbi:hypothetical protein F4703DRAFT_1824951, partial [Phycomyces blakesleeanus]
IFIFSFPFLKITLSIIFSSVFAPVFLFLSLKNLRPLFFATSLTHLKRNNIHIACPIRILTETLHFVRENDPILGVFDHIILWGCFLSSEALEILLKYLYIVQ